MKVKELYIILFIFILYFGGCSTNQRDLNVNLLNGGFFQKSLNKKLSSSQVYLFNNIGENEKEVIRKNLLLNGYTVEQSHEQITALNLDGKTAYMISGFIFVGDQKSILKGNYMVAGINKFPHRKDIQYLANYNEHVLQYVNLSDHRILEFVKGSPYDFTVTLRSNDNRRVYAAAYRKGQKKINEVLNIAQYNNPKGIDVKLQSFITGPCLYGSILQLNDFGVTIEYDLNGNITPYSISKIRSGGKNYIYSKILGTTTGNETGFALRSKTSCYEERYSHTGRRIFDDSDNVDYIASEPIETDTLKDIMIKIADLDNENSINIIIPDITKERVLLSPSKDGQFTRITTRMDVLCQNPEKKIEKGTMSGGKIVWKIIKNFTPVLPYSPALIKKSVINVNFFESGNDVPAYGDRTYTGKFDNLQTRYINFELNFNHPSYGNCAIFPIEAVWADSKGNEITRQRFDAAFSSDWKTAFVCQGWGSSQPGFWKPGTYTVNFYYAGNKITTASFKVK